jgi:hypothetical protein
VWSQIGHRSSGMHHRSARSWATLHTPLLQRVQAFARERASRCDQSGDQHNASLNLAGATLIALCFNVSKAFDPERLTRDHRSVDQNDASRSLGSLSADGLALRACLEAVVRAQSMWSSEFGLEVGRRTLAAGKPSTTSFLAWRCCSTSFFLFCGFFQSAQLAPRRSRIEITAVSRLHTQQSAKTCAEDTSECAIDMVTMELNVESIYLGRIESVSKGVSE